MRAYYNQNYANRSLIENYADVPQSRQPIRSETAVGFARRYNTGAAPSTAQAVGDCVRAIASAGTPRQGTPTVAVRDVQRNLHLGANDTECEDGRELRAT